MKLFDTIKSAVFRGMSAGASRTKELPQCHVVLNGNGVVMTSDDNEKWRYDNRLLRLAQKQKIVSLDHNGRVIKARDANGNVYSKEPGQDWQKAS